MARLWRKRDELRALASAHPVLLERYRMLSSFSDYRMELRPHVDAPFPKVQTLRATHRLWLGMQAASYFEGGGRALDAVLDDLRFWRRALAQADDLLMKIVVADLIAENLHVFAAFMDKEDALLGDFPDIAPLSGQEGSLESALASEFRFTASVLLTLETRPETYDDLGVPRWLGAVGLRPMFKPNRSLNSAYHCWRQVPAATPLRPAGAPAHGSSPTERGCTFGWSEWVSNPIGTILISIARPDFGGYAAGLQDLGGLITLVNLKRSIRTSGITPNQLADYLSAERARFSEPYRGDPVSWESESRTLHFTSPNPRRGYHRLPLEPMG